MLLLSQDPCPGFWSDLWSFDIFLRFCHLFLGGRVALMGNVLPIYRLSRCYVSCGYIEEAAYCLFTLLLDHLCLSLNFLLWTCCWKFLSNLFKWLFYKCIILIDGFLSSPFFWFIPGGPGYWIFTLILLGKNEDPFKGSRACNEVRGLMHACILAL